MKITGASRMTTNYTQNTWESYPRALKLPQETEWVRIQGEQSESQDIGEYVSVFRTRRRCGQAFAICMGCEDTITHLLGTNFSHMPANGGQLRSWRYWLLRPAERQNTISFSGSRKSKGKQFVLLEIERATGSRFNSAEWKSFA